MERMFLSTALELKEINTFEPDTWINLVNPSREESVKSSEQFNIDVTDLRVPLDLEEASRVTVEDDYTSIIVDMPTYEERDNKSYCITISLGTIVIDNAVIATCLQELTLFDNFFNHRVKNFYTFMRTCLVFQLLYRNIELFLTALRSIDRQSDRIEAELENATRNEQLINMMESEKSIVYLEASLKFNKRIVKKLSSSTSSLKKYIEDGDLFEDILIETQQAIEMADTYENVLSAMAEATASVISNSQNTIMKTLALMVMALDIPAVIFSAYGINFQNNWLPPDGLPHTFQYIVFIAAAIGTFVIIYFFRKKWF